MNSPYLSRVFVGRQEVYDQALNVVAYELLHRSCLEDQIGTSEDEVELPVDNVSATSELLTNAVIEVGLDNLVFGRPAFVRFTQKHIVSQTEIPFDPKQIVIVVPASVEPCRDVISALSNMKDQGYTVALDHFEQIREGEELLDLADIVRIDLRQYGMTELQRIVNRLKSLPVKLLADRVEVFDAFEMSKSLGFNYFQGYFLSRPQVVERKTLTNNQMAILQLMVKLQDPNVRFDEVVELVKQDISLSVKLLRHVNSLAHAPRHPVDSVRQAAVRLGLQQIRQIVTLIAANGLGQKPPAVFAKSIIRARMCEILGKHLGQDRSESCFTVGLFSSLDAFLDQPLPEIINDLPFTTEIRDAILLHKNAMGHLLSSVKAFERGNWAAIQPLGATEEDIQSAYLSAVAWGNSQSEAAFDVAS